MDTARKAVSVVPEQIANAEKKLEEKLTILWHELHPWQQDNHFIVRGYRPASNSFAKSAKSLLFIHNETINIYTHLVGSILAIIAGVTLYHALEARYVTANMDDVIVFGCYFAGAAVCLGMSATYHMISNHSEAVASFGNKLDYLGIVALIWGSFVPSIFYGFQSDPQLIKFFWTMITTIGAGCAIVSISPRFRTPALRPFRAAMFVSMGLSAVFPVIHGIKLYGLEQLSNTIGLPWLVLQGALYVIGAAIYAARVPERFNPGYFDILGSSHQIFHVLVVLAAAAHLVGLLKAFDYKHSLGDNSKELQMFKTLWR